MTRERPTCRECACTKVCEYFENENEKNLDEVCPLCYWEKYFVPKREWISVEERLPEDADERVLVYIVSERCYTELDTDRFVGGRWVRWGDEVTHWMTLPEPPETEGETE
jgi:hypothetical protein